MQLSVATWIVLAISLALTGFVWVALIRISEHWVLKIAIGVIAIIPVLGPLIGLWLVGMPSIKPRASWATMNHYGLGGRFIGFGSRRFSHPDITSVDPQIDEHHREKKRKPRKPRSR